MLRGNMTSFFVSFCGIFLYEVTHSTVRKDTSNFGEYGIYLYASSTNTISDNTAKSNSDDGVHVNGNSTGNIIKKNVLHGNGIDAIDESTGSQTAGIANTWASNKRDTSTPAGLCKLLAIILVQ